MKVVNPGPAVVVAGQYDVAEGETVDLPSQVAKSLVRQGWKKAKEPKPEEAEE